MLDNSVPECNWGTWRSLTTDDSTPTPSARVGHTAHAVQNHSTESQLNIIVLGGANLTETLNEALVYDVISDKWTQIQLAKSTTDVPGLARYEHSSVWLPNGQIFVFGGATQTGPLGDLMQLQFSPSADQSQACLTSPTDTSLTQFEHEARTQHSSTCLTECEQILVFAGAALGNQPVSDSQVHMYDIRKNRWLVVHTHGECPCARFGHVALYEPPTGTAPQDNDCTFPRGRLFIHGGMAESKFFDDFYQLQMTTTKDGQPAGEWQLLSTPASSPVANPNLSPDKSLWTVKPELCHIGCAPCARAAHGGALLPRARETGIIVLFGGVSSEGALNDMYCFDTETRQWTEITFHEPVPKPRLDFACCVYTRVTCEGSDEGDEIRDRRRRHYFFVHGGMDTDGNLFNDAWSVLLAEENLNCPGLENPPT